MIIVSEKNKQSVIDKYGEEVYREIESITNVISTVHQNKASRTMLFEALAHDNLRNIQHNYMFFPSMDYHNHNFYEFTHVLEGAVIEIMADKSYIIEKGETIILSPSVTHCFHVLADTKHASFFIKSDWFCEMGNLFGINDPGNYISNLCSHNIFTVFSNITGNEYDKTLSHMFDIQRTVYRSTGLFDNLYFENLFISCLIMLTKQNRREYLYSSDTSGKGDIAQRIVSYIVNNCSSVTLEEVANHFSFSRTHIHRILKQSTGETFTKLVANERVRQAKLLLLNTRMPISKIAHELGFKNRDSFSKEFKKRRLITPAQYRRYNPHVGKLRNNI